MSYLRSTALALLLGFASTAASQDITISEFMASNTSTSVAGQVSGQFHDWIELRNNTEATIDLLKWHLTDDEGVPFKWTFPSASIPPGGFLVVFASGSGIPASGSLHTNFSLSSGSGYLALVRPNLSVASSYDYPKQFADVSFGTPGIGAMTIHLATATPGATNGTTEYLFVQDTKFSQKRGYFTTPFNVTITTTTPSSIIRYTTDGSAPDETGNGTSYSAPVAISTTTILRARAFRSGYAPTNIDTQSYIFPVAVRTQTRPSSYPTSWGAEPSADYDMDPDVAQSPTYSTRLLQGLSDLPTLSLATQMNAIFGPAGIYSDSTNDAIETGVSAEYFHPGAAADGTNVESGFHLDCGLKIQGGSSRNPSASIKHSFSLRFRTDYGESKLKYGLFPESPVEEYNSLQLRAMYNNSWIHSTSDQRERATMIRDQWARDSLIAMGQADGGYGKFVHLYINGLYWGVYNLHERPDNNHYAAYNGGDPDTIDAKNPSFALASFDAMKSVVASGTWPQIAAAIDVDHYIDFYLLQQFVHNDDINTTGNWRAAGGGSSNSPWHFHAWDTERILENVSATGNLAKSQDGVSLIDSLDNHEEFRIRAADRIQKHLFNGGALTPEKNRARYAKYSDLLDRAIIAESARWGDDCRAAPYTRDVEWITEVNKLKDTFFRSASPNRTTYVITKFQTENWPSGDGKLLNATAPNFQVNGSAQHGGQIDPGDAVGFGSIPGTVYYTTNGFDPRVPATGGSPVTIFDDGSPCTAFVPNNGSLALTWTQRVFDDSAWIQGTTGVGYDNGFGSYNGLFNTNVAAMKNNTSSCFIRVPFTIPNQATLDTIGTLSLNMKFEDGFAAWINGVRVTGYLDPASPQWDSSTGNIDREPESGNVLFTPFDVSAGKSGLVVGTNVLAIQVLNTSSGSSDILCIPQLTYTPSSATGISGAATAYTAGFQLPDTTTIKARTRNGSNWSPLVEATFIVEPLAEPGDLVVSELTYHPADPTQPELAAGQSLTPPQLFDDGSFEFIEFLNTAPHAINLDGVHFTDGIEFTFGPVIMLPGERIVLARNFGGFAARYGSLPGIQIIGPYAGALNNSGELITFATAGDVAIQSFAYDDGGSWPGRADGAASSLELNSPDADPSLSGSWRPSSELNGSPGSAGAGPDNRIKVNEVLTHSELPNVDSIELYNGTGEAIIISGWYLSDTRDNYTRFQIPPATVIPANGFIVFDETNFNASGTPADFALSGAHGDDVYLLEANAAGSPTRFVDHVEFGGSLSGVTLGRWPDGTGQLVPMTSNTLGGTNSSPLIGSVIISEFMYHPSGAQPGQEFIEILNCGANGEDLANWTLRGGVDFDFNASHNLSAGGTLVLVNFDPVADTTAAITFRNAYSINAGVPLAGPWTNGYLDNGGDLITLQRPDTPPLDEPDFYPQVIEDIADFDDAAPWPATADGAGDSLHRVLPPAYGSVANSWTASPPNPGTTPISDDSDFDNDGIPALLEIALGLNPFSPDSDQLPTAVTEGDQLTYSYPKDTSKADITYQLETSIDLVQWLPLADTLFTTNGAIETRKASIPLSGQTRFLRLRVSR